MNAKEFSDIINKIEVDGRTKEGILELIDLKTLSNMEPILNEMKSEFKIITSELKRIEDKTNSEFKIINSELKRIEDKNDTKSNMLIALLGILITVLVALRFFS